ncbi:MAG: LuxR C-terminal-related transcriptional regulator [Eggerthellaceae bacterium]|jgi:DNA-binding NarL/FixJ family response regulator
MAAGCKPIRHACSDNDFSHSTAKSHIYNIYGKLDVHSKQELIDLIEHTQVPHYKDDPE